MAINPDKRKLQRVNDHGWLLTLLLELPIHLLEFVDLGLYLLVLVGHLLNV